MAIDITIKDPSGTTTYYPKTVSDLVYDNGTRKALSVQRKEDLVNLIEKLGDSGSLATLFGYTRYNGYKPTYDAITNTVTFTSTADTKYIVYIVPITKGTIYRRTAQSTVNRTIYIAYTTTEITSGGDLLTTTFDNVTRENNTTVFDTISIAPYDGYLMLYMYNQDWVSGSTTSYKLDLSKINEKISDVDDEINSIYDYIGEDRVSSVPPINGIAANTATYTEVTDLDGNPIKLKEVGRKYTVTAHYTDESGEGYARLGASGGGNIYYLSATNTGGTITNIYAKTGTYNVDITSDVSYTFTVTQNIAGGQLWFWSRVRTTDKVYLTVTEYAPSDSIIKQIDGINEQITDINQKTEVYDNAVGKLEGLEYKLHYSGSTNLYSDDVYTDPTYVWGTIQPNGTVSSSPRWRTSPTMKVMSPKIRFTANPSTVTLEGDSEVYNVNIRLVVNDGSSWSQLNTHSKSNKTFDVSPYTKYRFTPFFVKKSNNDLPTSAKVEEIIAYLQDTYGKVLSINIGYLNSDNLPFYVYEGIDLNDLDARIDALEEEIGELDPSNTDIITLNNERETRQKLRQLNKGSYTSNSKYYKNLNLVHFSDLHDCTLNLRRIMDYYKYYESYFDGIIQTGDFVGTQFSNTSPYTTLLGEEEYSESVGKLMNAIGNHDTAKYSSSTGFTWTEYVGISAYTKFIAPSVENWGVVQPENAATSGYCYYYKDYETKVTTAEAATSKVIRLIVLDDMDFEKYSDENPTDITLSGSTQMQWFEDVLNDARNSNCHVILATHYGYKTSKIKCAISQISKSYPQTKPKTSPYILNRIGEFVRQGGIFVCNICGHSHYDNFGTYDYTVTTTTYHIPVINIDTAAAITQPLNSSDFRRTLSNNNTVTDKSFDLFNILSVDTVNNIFSIMRVGADIDSKLRHCGGIAYYYGNLTLDNDSNLRYSY